MPDALAIPDSSDICMCMRMYVPPGYGREGSDVGCCSSGLQEPLTELYGRPSEGFPQSRMLARD